MGQCIWIQNKRYYYYDTYMSWEEARRIAQIYKKQCKECKYFIIKTECGLIIPIMKYKLFMTHAAKLGW